MAKPPPKIPSMFEMLMAQAASAANLEPRRQWPMNPFLSGVREGSATDRVRAELRRAFPQPLDHGQLRFRLGASRGAINWATAYLIHQGEIVAVSDPRSPQYKRYRATIGTDFTVEPE